MDKNKMVVLMFIFYLVIWGIGLKLMGYWMKGLIQDWWAVGIIIILLILLL